MIELIWGVWMVVTAYFIWLHENEIKALEKRVDFLMLAVVSGVLAEEATGDGEKDFQILIDKMDTCFGRKEKENENGN